MKQSHKRVIAGLNSGGYLRSPYSHDTVSRKFWRMKLPEHRQYQWAYIKVATINEMIELGLLVLTNRPHSRTQEYLPREDLRRDKLALQEKS